MFVCLDLDERCVRRVAKRVEKGGQHVPENDVRNLIDNWKTKNGVSLFANVGGLLSGDLKRRVAENAEEVLLKKLCG